MDAEWFRTRKRDLKLNDSHLAEAVKRDRSLINKVIRGAADFQLEFLEPLATQFRVPKEEILYRFGVLDRPPTKVVPADDELQDMLANALLGVPPGTPLADYPRLAAPGLRGQLSQFAAGDLVQADDADTATSPDIAAQSPLPTKASARAKSRTP